MKAYTHVHWGSFPTIPMDRLSLKEKVFVTASLVAVFTFSLPNLTLAHTAQNTPLVFEVNNIENISTRQENFLAKALSGDVPLTPPDPRVEILREYLKSKNSPFAPHSEFLLQQHHYRLIIGISFAESNFCKIQIRPNNCWGIGGSRPETYADLEQAITRANNLIQRYHNNGMTTPKLMRTTWVGWHNEKWPMAVEQVTYKLEQLGI